MASGYRTYEEQQELYAASESENGSEHAASYLTNPGYSEHHTGLAMDLSIYYEDTGESAEFDGTGKYVWFDENSWKYGFIHRYNDAKAGITGISGETWHFRYVGIPHAYYMKENDLCLEEYIDLLRQYDSESPLEINCQGKTYEVYFCSGTEVKVPNSGSYTISGNNVDGFIVTVEK